MRKNMMIGVSIVFASVLVVSSTEVEQPSVRARAFFVSNLGQVDPQVKYYVRGASGTVFLTATEMVFDFLNAPTVKPDAIPTKTGTVERLVFRMRFDGANPQPEIVGQKKLPGKINRFIGAHEKWKSNIPTFAELLYRNIYDGVDLLFSLPNNNMRYAIHLCKKEDLEQVRFTYQGVKELAVNDKGYLVISTPFGDFTESPPKVRWGGKTMNVRFRLIAENCVGFDPTDLSDLSNLPDSTNQILKQPTEEMP